MKKIINLIVICVISINAFSQTYKMETVFTDFSKTYLSCWTLLEDSNNSNVNIFSLWGDQEYDLGSATYEVEYFNGEAKEVFEFLKNINEFNVKYQNENSILTFIKGVKVKTFSKTGIKYTIVYDKEQKVFCRLNQRQWVKILDQFISYCETQGINYK